MQEKSDKEFFKNLDTRDPEQMEQLKKRDIKRYRKEMRKIKKALGPGVQVQPKPIRQPEEIKEIKSKKFNKIKNKLASNDFKHCVKSDNVESIKEFINTHINKHIQESGKKSTESWVPIN